MRLLLGTLLLLVSCLSVPEIAPAQDADAAAIGAANGEVVALYERGAYAEAIKLAEETLETSERVLGPEHPDTLASVNNLAFLYRSAGPLRRGGAALPPGAGGERARARPRASRHARQRQQPGVALRERRAATARRSRCYRRALEARERVLGPEHPQTLVSVNNLAALYASAGPLRRGRAALPASAGGARARARPRASRDAHQRQQPGVPLREPGPLRRGRAALPPRAGGAASACSAPSIPRRSSASTTWRSLYESQGRYGEAEPLYRRALEARERVLGPEHPDTLTSVNNLAALYQAQGRYGEAEPLYRRALEASERVLGPEHPDTLTSVNNLALLYEPGPLWRGRAALPPRAGGARAGARPRASRHARQRQQPGGALRSARAATARPSRSTAARWRRASGCSAPSIPTRSRSVNNLAGLYGRQGRYGEAEPLYRRALEASERVLGPEHPDTLTQRQQPGGALRAPGPLRRGRAALPPGAGGERARARPRASRHARHPRQPRRPAGAHWPLRRGAARAARARPASRAVARHRGPHHPRRRHAAAGAAARRASTRTRPSAWRSRIPRRRAPPSPPTWCCAGRSGWRRRTRC